MHGSKAPLFLLRGSLQRAAKSAHLAPLLGPACGLCVVPLSAAHGALSTCKRWQSTTPFSEDAAQSATLCASSKGDDVQSDSDAPAMERAADARRDVHELWSRTAAAEELAQPSLNFMPTGEAAATEAKAAEERCEAVAALLDKYKIDPATPREEDVSRGLGDALDRLLLLCVPLSSKHGTDLLVKLMHVSARQGRQLSMRTIQHLFARTNSYAEALAIFYAMRRSNFAMSMEAYHAMLYSLQRLEEEGWAARFHEEFAASNGAAVSEQALDFVLRGVDNQLMPENKPWLGRIMFAEVKDNKATKRQSIASFDAMGKLWVQRYKSGTNASE
ncbi:hypothetical protein LSCM1_03249 [Leishmania martiniquensis]|uniref:Uncharacterized protein n=1 Tax=Leishmania martiniquensis TaxID=1580590 RepID=A0A836GYV5_9TRYP|nr:hypothetical protein LSCM1_03249 [Leishmania martiniquensis]